MALKSKFPFMAAWAEKAWFCARRAEHIEIEYCLGDEVIACLVHAVDGI